MILPLVQQLLVLQERDQKIRNLQRELKDLPKHQQRAQDRLTDDETAVTQTKQRLTEIELKIKSVELDIQTRKTSIQRLKDQQFNTRKNEEFQALGHEVRRYEKDVNSLEDKELEFMEQIEAKKPAYAAAQAKLAETKKHVQEELDQIAEREKNIQGKLAGLKAERSVLVAPLEPSAVSLYERLMKSKGDAAVVPVNGNICGGCHMKIVIATLIKIKANEEITQCEQCGRVLYTED